MIVRFGFEDVVVIVQFGCEDVVVIVRFGCEDIVVIVQFDGKDLLEPSVFSRCFRYALVIEIIKCLKF